MVCTYPSCVVSDALAVKHASFLCVSSLFETAGAHLVQYSFTVAEKSGFSVSLFG